MGCLIVILAWLSPRLVIAVLWAFTERMTIAFDSGVVAVLGFLFLPYTTVMWALAYAPVRGVTGFGWVVLVLGLLADLSSYGGGGRQAANRRG